MALAALASAYADARRWVPIPPRCLVDALALYRLSLRKGFAPTLVFGVRSQTFAAHCWLQSHSAVLTGTAEEASNFRSEEHTSELQSLMRISYAVFCLNNKISPLTPNYHTI